jgi:ribosomal protein S8
MHSNAIKFLIALKNASLLKKECVFFSFNKSFLKLLKILYKTGLIQDFEVKNTTKKIFKFIVFLKYSFNTGCLNTLKIISKPSWSLFLKYKNLIQLSNKKAIVILSTSKGFLTSEECKKYKIGGKIFFYVK